MIIFYFWGYLHLFTQKKRQSFSHNEGNPVYTFSGSYFTTVSAYTIFSPI